MHAMSFQSHGHQLGTAPGAQLNPGTIDPQLWGPVANIVTPEKVQEMYESVLKLQKYQREQEAKNRERDEADKLHNKWLDQFRKTQDALQQHGSETSLTMKHLGKKNERNNNLAVRFNL